MIVLSGNTTNMKGNTMATIKVLLQAIQGQLTEFTDYDFEVESGLEQAIEQYAEEWVDELNVEKSEDEDDWELDGWEIVEHDYEFDDPGDFSDLDEYADFVEACEEHGEGYRLRFQDVGEHNFEDEYQGCYDSEEDFVQGLLDDCYDVPDFLNGYIDLGKLSNDWMMDYSVYSGNDGLHIFRDC